MVVEDMLFVRCAIEGEKKVDDGGVVRMVCFSFVEL